MRRATFLLAALFATLFTTGAFAHTSGTSFIELRAQSDGVIATYDFDLRDLNRLLQLDANVDGDLTWGEIDSASTAIEAAIVARTKLATSSECRIDKREPLTIANHGDGPFARVTLTFSCNDAATLLMIDHRAWFDFDPGHRALLVYTDARAQTQTLLTQATPTWRVSEGLSQRLKRFLFEGAHHLLIGYDHLAFLGVLLLALARRPRNQSAAPLRVMLKRAFIVITAFTVAHSFTLALAATETLTLPSKPVEIAIAASVILAAVLNLWRGAAEHGWKLAFAFGLVHGLGFAGALAEMTRERIDLLALAAFNVGIEAAQLAVASIAAPILWFIFRNTHSERIALPIASLSVAALAGFWVAERIA